MIKKLDQFELYPVKRFVLYLSMNVITQMKFTRFKRIFKKLYDPSKVATLIM